MIKRTLLAAAFLLPMAAMADDAAPVTDSLDPPACKKPIVPSAVRAADDNSEFEEHVADYQKCINDYVNAQSELMKRHQALANDAINGFNDYIKKVNSEREQRQMGH